MTNALLEFVVYLFFWRLTLPETNAPENWQSQTEVVVFQPSISVILPSTLTNWWYHDLAHYRWSKCKGLQFPSWNGFTIEAGKVSDISGLKTVKAYSKIYEAYSWLDGIAGLVKAYLQVKFIMTLGPHWFLPYDVDLECLFDTSLYGWYPTQLYLVFFQQKSPDS